MNLRDLMNKLDTIAEAPEQAAPVDPQRAAYDQFRADDAKKAAVDQVKAMNKPNGNSNYIDPKDGVIKYMDNQSGRGGSVSSVKEFPYDWFKKGQESSFFNVLKAAGLEVIPVERKQLFGTSQVAGVDLAKLATLGQAPAAAALAPAVQSQANATSDKVNSENIQKLNDLTFKLSQTKGATSAAKTAVPPQTKVKASGQPAAQSKAPAQKKTMPGGYTSSPNVDQMGNVINNESIQFNGAIANALVESFGYETLDELALPTGINALPTGIKNFFGGFGKGVSNPRMTNLPKVADGTAKGSSGAKVGAAVATNPGKVAAGSAALGAGAAMLAANNGSQPATVEVPGVSGQPTAPGTTPAAPGTTPAVPLASGPTPEQLEIIKQMQEIMKQLEGDTSTDAANAISNAQAQISAITASKEQAAQDATTADAARAAAEKAPTAASIISNSPVVQASQSDKRTPAEIPASKDLGSFAGESVDNELSRWLKIARGR